MATPEQEQMITDIRSHYIAPHAGHVPHLIDIIDALKAEVAELKAKAAKITALNYEVSTAN